MDSSAHDATTRLDSTPAATYKPVNQDRAAGKLTIFLGYAPGLGKTNVMLAEGCHRAEEGLDVIMGCRASEESAEVKELAARLEGSAQPQPRRWRDRPGEMNLDDLLARRPQLALVDDLAHTNVPGSRHPKRCQDVEELLAAGIDVYATLNIAQIESLSDLAAQITGAPLVETTVPDRLIDEAYDIQVVDLPPPELLRRWREGKIRMTTTIEASASRFYRPGNLIALRQMMLRWTADRLDGQMRAYMQTQAIAGPWPARERLLVCISPSPSGERLVRAARRLADRLNAAWFVIFVETPDQAQASAELRSQVSRTLGLAEELGARAITVSGANVAEAVLAYARDHNITKIIAGKPLPSRWRRLLRGSVVDHIIRQSGPIDVHVIGGSSESPQPARSLASSAAGPWWHYAISVTLVAGATLLSEWLRATLSTPNLLMIYLFAVILAALALGRGPAMLASILGALTFDFFIVPPYRTLAIDDTEYLLTMLGLFVVGVVISSLTSRYRFQVQTSERRASETATLNALSRDLAAAGNRDAILKAIVDNIAEVFGREVAILLPGAASESLKVWTPGAGFILTEHEQGVADWAFRHGLPAGRGTGTLPDAQARYLPLNVARGCIGVLGVKPADPSTHLSPDQRRLLEAFASLAALALERAHLAEEAERARVQIETERMRSLLLSSVSHDLRTPLATITGAASGLMADDAALDAETRRDLTQSIYEEADRLNALLRNLLDMTRLESGAIRVRKAWQPLEEVIGAALTRKERALAGRMVTVDLPADLPLVLLDEVTIELVLVNLLENALKYTPAGSPIELSAWAVEGGIVIEVADSGPGLAAGDEQRVFEKFYRAHPGAAGVGLGLAICRGIVEAHGGSIWALNRTQGGAAFRFHLPIAGQPPTLALDSPTEEDFALPAQAPA